MHANAALLERFYTAFSKHDPAPLAGCYHPQAHFTDEVFDLHGERIAAMWRMLCVRGTDLRLEFRDIQADDRAGSAHWEAWYSFSATGRKVHNVIEASFEFKDGLILRHIDRFDFWRWSRQALGPPGLLLGWSGALRKKVQATAAHNLDQFIAKQ